MGLKEALQDAKHRHEQGEINEGEFKKVKAKILSEYSNTKGAPDAKVSTSPRHISTELYKILGLEPNATEKEIRQSYRKLSLRHHPDRNNGAETEEWYKISRAYQVLSNNDKRAVYDQFGSTDIPSKAMSFNVHVGGDSWIPYIGELELDFMVTSFIQQGEEMEKTKEINKRQHLTRISEMEGHLKDKFSKYTKQLDDDPRAQQSFLYELVDEAKRLKAEPNGANLLRLLGNIYSTKAASHLQSTWFPGLGNAFESGYIRGSFLVNMLVSYFIAQGRWGTSDVDKNNKVFWHLAQSEITSTVKEVCDRILGDQSVAQAERDDRVEFLKLLGNRWVELSNAVEGDSK